MIVGQDWLAWLLGQRASSCPALSCVVCGGFVGRWVRVRIAWTVGFKALLLDQLSLMIGESFFFFHDPHHAFLPFLLFVSVFSIQPLTATTPWTSHAEVSLSAVPRALALPPTLVSFISPSCLPSLPPFHTGRQRDV